MRTPALPIPGRTRTTLWLVAVMVSIAGVALALAALGLAVWETLGRFGNTPLYFLVREWMASPTMLLVVSTIIWIERLVTLHRGGHTRLVRMGYRRSTTRAIGRAAQWFGLLAAWVGSAIALQRVADFGVTGALVTGMLTFGPSMWLLEGLSFGQALTERDAESAGQSESGPIGC